MPVREVGRALSAGPWVSGSVPRGQGKSRPGAAYSQHPTYQHRRDAETIVCISPVSTLGPSQAPITLAIDRANISSPGVLYTYTQDPTVTRLEPTWSIIK